MLTKTQKIKHYLPTIAFFGGFLWDAMTIGRKVAYSDLWILLSYLIGAALILWWLGYHHEKLSADERFSHVPLLAPSERNLKHRIPFLALQFLYGGLFSALFILYFKSANHILALFLAATLGGLLVANEFIDDKYHRFTITWALFGLCAMLLFNFLLPFIVGSIAWPWFYLSTFAGAALAHYLRIKTPGCPGRASPVWVIAAFLALAYPLDIIPPVPLVKRDVQVGLYLEKSSGDYKIQLERNPWWQFWQKMNNQIHLPVGEKLYCISSVFAPRGLNTKLYHRWEYYSSKQGWQTTSRIGFGLAGGRDNGFRGFTYKQNVQAGKWKVSVETENGRTVAIHQFKVVAGQAEPDSLIQYVF
jgi:hypothetical protein